MRLPVSIRPALLTLALVAACQAHATSLFLPVAAPAMLDAVARQALREASADPQAAARWVAMNAAAVDASTGSLEFELDGQPVRATQEHAEVLADGTTTWSGVFVGSDGQSGSIHLVRSAIGVTGIIDGAAMYRLSPAGADMHLLSRSVRQNAHGLHPAGELPRGSAFVDDARSASAGKVEAAETSVFRVIAVTSQGRYQSEGARLRDRILLGITEGNATYRRSNIDARMELAEFKPVAYREESSLGAILARFRDSRTAESKAARALRDSARADVVMLVMGGGYYCGLAPVGAGAEDAFMVVRPECLTGNDTVPHELGHIAGASHDRETSGGGGALRPWAYGNRNCRLGRRSWHTVMAYPCANGSVRTQSWSSPVVLHEGQPTGSAAYADNRRVMEENRVRVAGFR